MNMIVQGPFCEVIKTGVFFSIANDDRVFTGDLYYDFVNREFQIRGIPCFQGRRRHVFKPEEKGPMKLHLLVTEVIEFQAREDNSNYGDLRFKKAKASGELAAHIEEWYGDRAVKEASQSMWEITTQLVWYRS